MRTVDEINERIERLEKRAEVLYNTGTPLAQNAAMVVLSEVDALRWVLEG